MSNTRVTDKILEKPYFSRVGIIINILDISQTIVDGYFNMMMIVDVTNCSKEVAVVSKELEEIGTSIGVTIHCQREEIFEKMHRL